jgi:hypothetical protein
MTGLPRGLMIESPSCFAMGTPNHVVIPWCRDRVAVLPKSRGDSAIWRSDHRMMPRPTDRVMELLGNAITPYRGDRATR